MTVRMVLVDRSTLNVALSALDRDATEGGKPIRAEIAELIRGSIDIPVFQTGMSKLGFDNLTLEQEFILKERLLKTINQFAMELHGGQV